MISTMFFSNHPNTRHLGYLAIELLIVLTVKKVRALAHEFIVPKEFHMLVPRESDRVLSPRVGYSVTHLEQRHEGLRFPLFPLLANILNHYNIDLTQLVPNSIRLIVGFEFLRNEKRISSSLSLFCFFYILMKSSVVSGPFAFSPGLKRVYKLLSLPLGQIDLCL